MAEIQLLAGCQ